MQYILSEVEYTKLLAANKTYPIDVLIKDKEILSKLIYEMYLAGSKNQDILAAAGQFLFYKSITVQLNHETRTVTLIK